MKEISEHFEQKFNEVLKQDKREDEKKCLKKEGIWVRLFFTFPMNRDYYLLELLSKVRNALDIAKTF